MASANMAGRPLPPRSGQQDSKPAAQRPAGRPVAKRPDARPMRIVYGAASVAALSALTVGLAHPSPPVEEVLFDTTADLPPPTAGPVVTSAPVEVTHVINYVQLKPGESPPPGATVIAPDAPAPRIVVTTIPGKVIRQPAAPSTTTTQPKKRVRTRQSGTP